MVEVASMVDVAMVVGGMAAGATTEVGTVMDAGEAVVALSWNGIQWKSSNLEYQFYAVPLDSKSPMPT